MSIQAMPACGDIKLPSMPGTRHDTAANEPLGQGTTGMRTDSIESMEAILQMKQCHDPPARYEFSAGPDWNIRNRSNSMTFRHGTIQSGSTRGYADLS